MNFTIFFHIAFMGEIERVFKEMIETIKESQILDSCSSITLNLATDSQADDMRIDLDGIKCKCFLNRSTLAEAEFPTIRLLTQHSMDNPGEAVLYIHSKGVSKSNECIDDWRRYMMHFNVTKWKDCLKVLSNGSDTCGVDWSGWPMPHYSGNFWWAKTDYINKIGSVDDVNLTPSEAPLIGRHKAEMWIGTGEGWHKNLHSSNIPVLERHLHRYPEEKYNCRFCFGTRWVMVNDGDDPDVPCERCNPDGKLSHFGGV